MTEKEFFKHDTTALGDRQLKKLVRENSCCGYAVFFASLEFMYQEDGNSIDIEDLVLDVSEGLYATEETVNKIIQDCLNLGLFSKDENGIYSNRVRSAISEREKEREKYRSMANMRWGKKDAGADAQANAQAMPRHIHRQCKKEKEEEKEEEKKEEKKKEEEYINTSPRKRVSHPTVEEVKAYCQERGNTVDPESFVDYYSSQNWKKANGEPLTDWKAGVRTWERKEKEKAPQFERKMVEDLEERNRLNASIDPRTGEPIRSQV